MTLEEVFKAKKLMYLEPFSCFRKCYGLTGRYYYNTATNKEDTEDNIVVEVYTGFFRIEKKFTRLCMFKELKEWK